MPCLLFPICISGVTENMKKRSKKIPYLEQSKCHRANFKIMEPYYSSSSSFGFCFFLIRSCDMKFSFLALMLYSYSFFRTIIFLDVYLVSKSILFFLLFLT